jgi:hypothetical protein
MGLLRCTLNERFEHYLVTKSLKLSDQPIFVRLPRAPAPIMEVILSEILISYFALQQVVADHQDGVSYCHRCLFGATSPLDASVLRPEVAPFGAPLRGPLRLARFQVT